MHNELYLFVVAVGRAPRFTWYDGRLGKPWSSLGGTFVSEPVALALFPQVDPLSCSSRINVFGVYADDQSFNQLLWRNWLDNQTGTAGHVGGQRAPAESRDP
jgi:hypothetical protein